MKKLFVSVVFFFLLITPKNIYGQWSKNPDEHLRIGYDGLSVNACEDGIGGAFVAWTDGSTQPRTWLQWVDKDGYSR